MKRVLFICSQNRLRSPTAEQVFADWPGIETSSAGLNHDAENPLTPDLLRWADIVFVMEQAHRRKLSSRFRNLKVPILCSGPAPTARINSAQGNALGCRIKH